jgi:hypothetical protein
MLVFWILVFVILIAVDRAWRFQNNTVVLESQFRLFKLRDDLRAAVTSGDVHPANWVFEYLDSSITRSIDALPGLHIWRVLGLMVTHRPDRVAIAARQDNLRRELAKDKNRILAQMYMRYVGEMGLFLIRRHSTFQWCAKTAIRCLNVGRYVKHFWQNVREFLTEAPETSTLLEVHRA